MVEEKDKMMQSTETIGEKSLVEEAIATMKGIPTEKELIQLLRETTQEVTFLKLDGDKRVMTCTKSFDIIPKENQPKSDKEPKQGTITVWDLNAKGWRSFKYDRVQTVLPVAQLDRASGYEPEGQEFESSQAGQILEKG